MQVVHGQVLMGNIAAHIGKEDKLTIYVVLIHSNPVSNFTFHIGTGWLLLTNLIRQLLQVCTKHRAPLTQVRALRCAVPNGRT